MLNQHRSCQKYEENVNLKVKRKRTSPLYVYCVLRHEYEYIECHIARSMRTEMPSIHSHVAWGEAGEKKHIRPHPGPSYTLPVVRTENAACKISKVDQKLLLQRLKNFILSRGTERSVCIGRKFWFRTNFYLRREALRRYSSCPFLLLS